MSRLTRRVFLLTGAAVTGGLLIGIGTGPSRRRARAIEATSADGETLVNLWLKISPDNQVTVLVDKLEMGQGAHSGLAMLVAEELGADWTALRVEHVPARPEFANGEVILTFLERGLGLTIPNMLTSAAHWTANSAARWFDLMFTGGSTSIMVGWTVYRKAGAAARQVLVEAGAEYLEADPDQCVTRNSRVLHTPSGRSVSFGKIAAAAALRPPPAEPALKPAEDFELIGQSLPRLDIPSKTMGNPGFGIDQRLPGLKFAAMTVPPLPGRKLETFDGNAVKEMPGVAAVVALEDGVAVVADSWWSAREGAKGLAAQFEMGELSQWSSEEHLDHLARQLDEAELDVEDSDGDMLGALTEPHGVVEAEYRVPYLAHAAMEPMNCTAWVRDGHCDVWTGTQAPLMARQTAADTADLAADKVTVHTTLAGGAFGRRFHNDAVARAVQIARAVDYPVQLIYSREDDMTGGFYRPAVVSKVNGSVDEHGKVETWRYRFSGSAQEVDLRPYQVPNYSIEALSVDEPIPTGPWRSVDHSQHAFFLESFIDELAAAAAQDPFEFRRRHLPTDSRQRQVLDELEGLVEWDGPGGNGRGRGVALHTSFGSVVGQVIDVTVQGERLTLDRVTAVVDCGVAVNPDSVIAQIQSAIIYGLSAALYGEITSTRGAIVETNFHNQPVLLLTHVPVIEVHVAANGTFPAGVGEPGTPPSAPALTNALFAATGKRFRRLPLRSLRV